jgi:hypothetical protein
MLNVERASWIAGIVSAVLALVATVWGFWIYFHPLSPEPPHAIDLESQQKMQAQGERQKRFMVAWEAATYAQGSVTRALNDKERKVYAAADQKLRDAMHFAELGGRDEEALRLYAESRKLFESLR